MSGKASGRTDGASRTSDLAAAIEILARAGVQIVMPESVGAVGVATAAAQLDVGKDWIRAHIEEFPNWYRLPAASSGLGQPAGEVRIPRRDLDAFEERRKKLRVGQANWTAKLKEAA